MVMSIDGVVKQAGMLKDDVVRYSQVGEERMKWIGRKQKING